MLEAVAYAQNFVYLGQDGSSHKGLIHRDLKPANMLITQDDRVKITDFGIVKLVGSEKTSTGGNYGSPEYVSPHHAEGASIDTRSDIYSLGIILYEMLAGRPPFHDHSGRLSQLDIVRAHIHRQPQPPSEINPQITAEQEAIILKAIEKKRENRFASAIEFLRAVRQVRGRKADGVAQSVIVGQLSRSDGGTREIVSPTMADSARDSYSTQPINIEICPACGASVQSSDVRCRQCGQELASSPATMKLSREEASEWRRTRAFGLWLGVAAALLALVAILIYFASNR